MINSFTTFLIWLKFLNKRDLSQIRRLEIAASFLQTEARPQINVFITRVFNIGFPLTCPKDKGNLVISSFIQSENAFWICSEYPYAYTFPLYNYNYF
mgnify:CR=1 FL=1